MKDYAGMGFYKTRIGLKEGKELEIKPETLLRISNSIKTFLFFQAQSLINSEGIYIKKGLYTDAEFKEALKRLLYKTIDELNPYHYEIYLSNSEFNRYILDPEFIGSEHYEKVERGESDFIDWDIIERLRDITESYKDILLIKKIREDLKAPKRNQSFFDLLDCEDVEEFEDLKGRLNVMAKNKGATHLIYIYWALRLANKINTSNLADVIRLMKKEFNNTQSDQAFYKAEEKLPDRLNSSHQADAKYIMKFEEIQKDIFS
jgi:hypothetical protein